MRAVYYSDYGEKPPLVEAVIDLFRVYWREIFGAVGGALIGREIGSLIASDKYKELSEYLGGAIGAGFGYHLGPWLERKIYG